ncbi:MAG: hypothetical protein K2F84_01400 [Bacteroidales bacterium]|nr:hypothetical protein [Bacteroidales bacterium]
MRSFIILIVGLLLPAIACARGTVSEPPAWVDGFFQEENNSYIEMVSASARSEAEARRQAAQTIMDRRSLATGRRVTVKQVQDGRIVMSGEDNLTVKARIIDEYVQFEAPDYYVVYLLVQTAKNPSYDFEKVWVTDRYPFSGREFVPGMAQIYKGQVGKGVGFIVGEVAFIGGIVASECLRASYVSKMNATRNVKQRQVYADNANICALSRNISIAGAAAVYVWNIIDGAVAKGRKHVLIGDARLQFAPYAAPDVGGLALSLTF